MLAVEHLLRRREIEQRERRAAEARRRAEMHESGDRVLAGAGRRHDLDLLTDGDPMALGCARVDHHLIRTGRGEPPGSNSNVVVFGSHEPPSGGAPPFWITLLVAGSMIHAELPIEPSAPATPSTASTFGRTLSGIGFRSAPPPPPPPPVGSKAVGACTTTDVPANTVPNRSSKLLSAVSVRMNEPAVIPTPSTTASAVSTSRSLRANRLLIVARSTTPPAT